jgi:hypothetical protein
VLGADVMELDNASYLLVFESYNQAMLLYNKILQRKCKVELVSTPCRLSRGCSQSIVFLGDDTTVVIEELKKSNIVIRGVYKIVNKNDKIEYVHI